MPIPLNNRIRPLVGGSSWACSLACYELAKFGLQGWWWKLHWALRQEFRDLDISALVSKHGGEHPAEFSYGETPSITLQSIFRMADLRPGKRFVDLGMGRGLTVLAAASLGYKASGLEILQEYVVRSHKVAQKLDLEAELLEGDMLHSDWPEGDLYLLNSTAFPSSFRESLVLRLAELSVGALVATFDWNLEQSGFEMLASARLPVTWGTVECGVFRVL